MGQEGNNQLLFWSNSQYYLWSLQAAKAVLQKNLIAFVRVFLKSYVYLIKPYINEY